MRRGVVRRLCVWGWFETIFTKRAKVVGAFKVDQGDGTLMVDTLDVEVVWNLKVIHSIQRRSAADGGVDCANRG